MIDTGTPELAARRHQGQTAEVIDLLCHKNLITPEQHRCALHFRWLYTLRFGCPGIRALNLLEHDTGRMMAPERSAEWLVKRETEYREAVNLLQRHGYLHSVVQAVMFDHITPVRSHTVFSDHPLYQGLDMLYTLWLWKRRDVKKTG